MRGMGMLLLLYQRHFVGMDTVFRKLAAAASRKLHTARPKPNIFFDPMQLARSLLVFFIISVSGGEAVEDARNYFELVNADTDEIIGRLPDRFSYDDPQIGTNNLNIQVQVGGSFGSMMVTMDRPPISFCERKVPYTVFRDVSRNNQTVYAGRYIPAGRRQVTATPYDTSDCTRPPAGQKLTKRFVVEAASPKPCLIALRIRDAETNEVYRTISRQEISSGKNIELGPDRPCNFRLQAVTKGCPLSGINFVRMRPLFYHKVETTPDLIVDERDFTLSEAPIFRDSRKPYFVAPDDGGKYAGNFTADDLSGSTLRFNIQVKLKDIVGKQRNKLAFVFSQTCVLPGIRLEQFGQTLDTYTRTQLSIDGNTMLVDKELYNLSSEQWELAPNSYSLPEFSSLALSGNGKWLAVSSPADNTVADPDYAIVLLENQDGVLQINSSFTVPGPADFLAISTNGQTIVSRNHVSVRTGSTWNTETVYEVQPPVEVPFTPTRPSFTAFFESVSNVVLSQDGLTLVLSVSRSIRNDPFNFVDINNRAVPHVYTRTSVESNDWSLIRNEIPAEFGSGSFDTRIALSEDGSVVAFLFIPIFFLNIDRVASVYVFELDQETGELTQLGNTVEGPLTGLFRSQASIGLSPDGRRFFVQREVGRGMSLEIYDYNGSSWEIVASPPELLTVDLSDDFRWSVSGDASSIVWSTLERKGSTFNRTVETNLRTFRISG